MNTGGKYKTSQFGEGSSRSAYDNVGFSTNESQLSHVRTETAHAHGTDSRNFKEQTTEDLFSGSGGATSWGRRKFILVVLAMVLVAMVILGVVIAVLLIVESNDDDTKSTPEPSKETTLISRSKFFTGNAILADRVWNNELRDTGSDVFRQTADEFVSEMEQAFAQDPRTRDQYASMSVTGFLPGSVIVVFHFKFTVEIERTVMMDQTGNRTIDKELNPVDGMALKDITEKTDIVESGSVFLIQTDEPLPITESPTTITSASPQSETSTTVTSTTSSGPRFTSTPNPVSTTEMFNDCGGEAGVRYYLWFATDNTTEEAVDFMYSYIEVTLRQWPSLVCSMSRIGLFYQAGERMRRSVTSSWYVVVGIVVRHGSEDTDVQQVFSQLEASGSVLVRDASPVCELVCPDTAHCFPKTALCDGSIECLSSGWDESSEICGQETTPSSTMPTPTDFSATPSVISTTESITTTTTTMERNICREDQFQCRSDGSCIIEEWICDDYRDCDDNSDEENCGCTEEEFYCGYNECISKAKYCDDIPDCEDFSDERGCPPRTVECEADEFECVKYAECVNSSLLCDGMYDCRDYSDEWYSCDNKLPTTPSAPAAELEVRLIYNGVDSTQSKMGRVEVRRRGSDEEFGTICDDMWSEEDARVVCRMIEPNFTGPVYAYSFALFGKGTGPIVMTNVDCTGDEGNLGHCRSRANVHCSHSEDAGVQCGGSPIPVKQLQEDKATVRLVHGPSCLEGNVEIFQDGEWRFICDDYFDDKAATVVCRMLGFNAGMGRLGSYYRIGDGKFWLDNVRCRGNETDITECDSNALGDHDCLYYEMANIVCDGVIDRDCRKRKRTCMPKVDCSFDEDTCCYEFPSSAPYMEGSSTWVWYNAEQINAVDVTLGLSSGGLVYYRNVYGNMGDFASLAFPQFDKGPVSATRKLEFHYLVEAYDTSALSLSMETEDGNVQELWRTRQVPFYQEGYWGHQCVDLPEEVASNGTEVMFVASRGTTGDRVVALDGISVTAGSCINTLLEAPCEFDEPSQCGMTIICEECDQADREYRWKWMSPDTEDQTILVSDTLLGYFMVADASNGIQGDVARLEFIVPSTEPKKGVKFRYVILGDKLSSLKVHIRQGDEQYYTWNSRYTDSTRSWQYACAHITDTPEVTTITFEAVHGARTFADIAIDLVELVSSCPDEACDLQTGNCTVRTYSSDPGQYYWQTSQGKSVATVRLVNGRTPNEGRVEVLHDGEWGTVCDDNWTLQDAEVVCRQLGYRYAVKHMTESYFGEGQGYIWMDEVKCDGSESSLADCEFDGWGNTDCDHTEDAGLECYSPETSGSEFTGDLYEIQGMDAAFGSQAFLVYPDLILDEGQKKLTFKVKQTNNDVLNIYLMDANDPVDPVYSTPITEAYRFESMCISLPARSMRHNWLIFEALKGRPGNAGHIQLSLHSINITSGSCDDTLPDQPCTFEDDFRLCSFTVSPDNNSACKNSYQLRRETGMRRDHTFGETAGHVMQIDHRYGEGHKESSLNFKQFQTDKGIPYMRLLLYYNMEDTSEPSGDFSLNINGNSHALRPRIPGLNAWHPVCVDIATAQSDTVDVSISATNISAAVDDVKVESGQCSGFRVNCGFDEGVLCGYVLQTGWTMMASDSGSFYLASHLPSKLVSPSFDLSGSEQCLTVRVRSNQGRSPSSSIRLKVQVLHTETGDQVELGPASIPVYHTDWRDLSVQIPETTGHHVVVISMLGTVREAVLEIDSISMVDGACSQKVCGDTDHSCGVNYCLPSLYVCDFMRDCSDGSDESHCPETVNCTFDNTHACGYQFTNSYVTWEEDFVTFEADPFAALSGDADLAFIETPEFVVTDSACLSITFLRNNNFNMFRVIRNTSKALSELENLGEVSVQGGQMTAMVNLPAGNYSLLLESQSIVGSGTTADIHVYDVSVTDGLCQNDCPADLFTCDISSIVCMPQDVKCNGQVECPSGADELGCSNTDETSTSSMTTSTSTLSPTRSSQLTEDFPVAQIQHVATEQYALDDAVIVCNVSETSGYKVTLHWYISGRQLSRDTGILHQKYLQTSSESTDSSVKYSVELVEDSGSILYSLKINRLDFEDSGNYACVVDVWEFNETQRPADNVDIKVIEQDMVLGEDNCYRTNIGICHIQGQERVTMPGVYGIMNSALVRLLIETMERSVGLMAGDLCWEPLQRLVCRLYSPDCNLGTEIPVCREDCEDIASACSASKILSYGCQFLPYRKENPDCKRLWLGCGMTYTAPEGILRSENYPQPYSSNTNCTYIVQAEKFHIIVFTLEDIDLGGTPSDDCKLVFNDGDMDEPLAEIQCGVTQDMKTFTTTTNRASVQLITDSNSTGRGVFIRYRQEPRFGCSSHKVDSKLFLSLDTEEKDNCSSHLVYAEDSRDNLFIEFTHLELGCVHIWKMNSKGVMVEAVDVCTIPFVLDIKGQVLFLSDMETAYDIAVTRTVYTRGIDFLSLDSYGRIEVTSEGEIGSVCGDLSENTGEIICQSVGNGYFVKFTEEESALPSLVRTIHCEGQEETITECTAEFDDENCGSSLSKAVVCDPASIPCNFEESHCGYDITGEVMRTQSDGLTVQRTPGVSGKAVSTTFSYTEGTFLHFNYTVARSRDVIKLFLLDTVNKSLKEVWSWSHDSTGAFTGCAELPTDREPTIGYQLVIELSSTSGFTMTGIQTGIRQITISQESCYKAACTFENLDMCETIINFCSPSVSIPSVYVTSGEFAADNWIPYDHTTQQQHGHYLVIDEGMFLDFLRLDIMDSTKNVLRFFYTIHTGGNMRSIIMTLYGEYKMVLQLRGKGSGWHEACVPLSDDIGGILYLALGDEKFLENGYSEGTTASLLLDDVSLSNTPCTYSFSCDFEDDCSDLFHNEDSSISEWLVLPVSTNNLHPYSPEYDVTFHSTNTGHILYADMEQAREGDMAITEINISHHDTRLQCLNFYFYLSGSAGSLKVKFNPDPGHIIEVANGNHGNMWQATSLTVSHDVSKVQFIAIKGSGESFVAVDDVSISSDNCVDGLQDLVYCRFDFPALCAVIYYSTSSDYQWTRVSTATDDPETLPYDADGSTVNGYYMSVSGAEGREGDKTFMDFRVFTGTQQSYQFWYRLSQSSTGSLTTSYSDGPQHSLTADIQDTWLMSPCFSLPDGFSGFVSIAAEMGTNIGQSIDVDNLRVLDSNDCKEPSLDCDFGVIRGSCGYLSVSQTWSRGMAGWTTSQDGSLHSPAVILPSGLYCLGLFYSIVDDDTTDIEPSLSVFYNEEKVWEAKGGNPQNERNYGQINLSGGIAKLYFSSSRKGVYSVFRTTLNSGACEPIADCSSEEFSCTSKCIPSSQRCDGTLDCEHGEDEDIIACGFQYSTSFTTTDSLSETGYRQSDQSFAEWKLDDTIEVKIAGVTQTIQTQLLVTSFDILTRRVSILQSPVYNIGAVESCLQMNYLGNPGYVDLEMDRLNGDTPERVQLNSVASASIRPFLVPVGPGFLQIRIIVSAVERDYNVYTTLSRDRMPVTFAVSEINLHVGVGCTDIEISCPEDIPLKCADNSGCYTEKERCDMTVTCLDQTDETLDCGLGIVCDFEQVNLCGYTNLTTPRVYFNDRSDVKATQSLWEWIATSAITRPTHDHTYQQISKGHFMSSRNYEGLLDTYRYVDTEIMQSPFQTFAQDGCVTFWYYLNSTGHQPKTTSAQLFVYLQLAENQDWSLVWFDNVNREFPTWVQGGVPVIANQSVSLIVKAYTIIPHDVYASVVALDDVQFIPGPCDVEYPVCDSSTFRCADDNVCVPGEFVCDGEPDCSDQSDENGCDAKPDGVFQLAGGDGTYGKLLYFYEHAWRVVCFPKAEFQQKAFQIREAHELCKMLGFSGNSDSFGHRFWEKHSAYFMTFTCDDDECTTEAAMDDCELYVYLQCSNDVCFSGEELCPGTTSTCRPRSHFCDGEMNCPANEDENNCYCKPGEEKCQHIEKECTEETTCETCRDRGQFECGNHQCLDLNLRCDGINHCADAADEYSCVQISKDLEVSVFDRASESRKQVCVTDMEVKVAQELCHQAGKGYLLEILRGTDSIQDGVNVRHSNQGTSYQFEIEAVSECFPLKLQCEMPECGTTVVRDSLIMPHVIHGEEAYIEEWPFFGHLAFNGEAQCGVTLLSADWAITALHCFYLMNTEYSLILGSSDGITGQWKQVIPVRDYYSYSTVKLPDGSFTHDLALIRLEQSALINDYTRPACLPTPDSIDRAFSIGKAAACYIVGLGATEKILSHPQSTNVYSNVIRKTRVDLISHEECKKPYEDYGGIPDDVICAAQEAPAQPQCFGDSGGPLVCQNQKGQWEVFGVLNFGLGYCDQDVVPSVAAAVEHYKEWIQSITGYKFNKA